MAGSAFYVSSLVSITTGNALDPIFVMVSWSAFGTHPATLSNLMVCSTETPDLVSHNVMWIPDCILLCQGDDRCLSVNWKEPNIREMFFIRTRTFTTLASCSYLVMGNLLKCYDNNYAFNLHPTNWGLFGPHAYKLFGYFWGFEILDSAFYEFVPWTVSVTCAIYCFSTNYLKFLINFFQLGSERTPCWA